MKRRLLRHKFALGLVAALAFASCSQEELTEQGTPLPVGQYPLTLTTDGLQTVATPAQASTRGTADNDWKGVTEVAVNVGEETKKYTATSADGGQTATLTSEAPFYWERSDEKKTITAWYPYSDGYPDNWLVEADQSTANGYQASDFIKGELKELTFANRDTKMAFEHRTAKVVVKLTATEGFVLDESTSVHLVNVSGVKDGGNTIKTYRPDNTEQTYLALLGGQTIAANENFIRVTANGTDFYYKPAAEKTLTAGKAYTYDITVKAEGITGVQVEVTPWDETGTSADGSTGDWQEADNIIRLSENADQDLVIDKNTVIDGSSTSKDNPFKGTITVNADDVIVLLKGVTVDTKGQAITVNGNATLVVQGENRVVSGNGAGVFIRIDKTVTITSQDKENNVLTSIGGNGGAGIGSSSADINGGRIVIRNVSVNAYGSKYSGALSYSAAIGNAESAYWGKIQSILIENSKIVAQRLQVGWPIRHIGNAQGDQAPVTIKSSTIEKRTGNDGNSVTEGNYTTDGTDTYGADGNLVTQ